MLFAPEHLQSAPWHVLAKRFVIAPNKDAFVLGRPVSDRQRTTKCRNASGEFLTLLIDFRERRPGLLCSLRECRAAVIGGRDRK